MADKVFVIYAANLGTSSARPVFEFYVEDETHVPDLAEMGYDANTAYLAVEAFAPTDTGVDTSARTLTIDPATAAVTQASQTTIDVARDQLAVSIEIETLVQEWKWTQALDARITSVCQKMFADWIKALQAIPGDAAWATNPKSIIIPPVPPVETMPLSIAQQIGDASWVQEAVVDSTKMNIANWETLQPVWGFDQRVEFPWQIPPFCTPTWNSGRSGHSALRVTCSGTPSGRGFVRTTNKHSFAMAAGDIFFVEAWVRGTVGTNIDLSLRGYLEKYQPSASFPAGSGYNTVVGGAAWKRISCYIQATDDAAAGYRWGTAQVLFDAAPGTWIEIDGLTVTRVPRLPNAYAKATNSVVMTATTTDFADAQELLQLPFYRAGSGATVQLQACCRIIPDNQASDLLRTYFYLTAKDKSGEVALATWAEFGTGSSQQRMTSITWTDDDLKGGDVTYFLKASKATSVNPVSFSTRYLSAALLPKL